MDNSRTLASSKSSASRKGKSRRTHVRDAALALFAEHGYDRTSLKDIADEVGLTHPALYYYYKSKSDILFDVVDTTLKDMLLELEDCVRDKMLDPEQKLCGLIALQVKSQFESQDANRLIDSVLFGTMSRSNVVDEVRAKQLHFLQQEIVKPYRTVLAEGRQAGLFNVANEAVATFAILGAVSNVPYWFKSEGRLSVTQVTKQVTAFILNALQPRP